MEKRSHVEAGVGAAVVVDIEGGIVAVVVHSTENLGGLCTAG